MLLELSSRTNLFSGMVKKQNTQAKQAALVNYPRCTGVLLHIISLPSSFGVGDFGPEAYRFANFLHRSNQTVWQILPINSSSSSQDFSPYGFDGTFAGGYLLISPEQLVKEGLLSEKIPMTILYKGIAKQIIS